MKAEWLPNLAELKAVFFDLDDTLVFSEQMHVKAWEQTLEIVGVDGKLIDFAAQVGLTDIRTASYIIDCFSLSFTPQELCNKKRDVFVMLSSQGFDSAAGRNGLLKILSLTHIIGVVSSSVTKVITEVLQVEKISHYFNFVIGYEDCEKHKPDPLPYQQALALAKVKPHEALVIEDSVFGIQSALNASIPVIGLLKDQRPEQIVPGVPYFHTFDEINKKLFEV